jgi:hypothetical protein
MKRLELTGQVFGKLRVIAFVGVDKAGHSVWSCVCDCGGSKDVLGDHLTRGNSTSCGCYNGMRTHGMYKSPEYHAYKHAKARCENPDTKQYEDYGSRGIQFKFSSFEEFFEAVGFKPKSKTLDRIDNDSHYESGNVRWATRQEQLFNTRRSIAKLMQVTAWG